MDHFPLEIREWEAVVEFCYAPTSSDNYIDFLPLITSTPLGTSLNTEDNIFQAPLTDSTEFPPLVPSNISETSFNAEDNLFQAPLSDNAGFPPLSRSNTRSTSLTVETYLFQDSDINRALPSNSVIRNDAPSSNMEMESESFLPLARSTTRSTSLTVETYLFQGIGTDWEVPSPTLVVRETASSPNIESDSEIVLPLPQSHTINAMYTSEADLLLYSSWFHPASSPMCRNDAIFSHIKWNSEPLPSWTLDECRHWISCLLMHGADFSLEEADTIAAKYHAWGHSIPLFNEIIWQKILGNEAGAIVFRCHTYLTQLRYLRELDRVLQMYSDTDAEGEFAIEEWDIELQAETNKKADIEKWIDGVPMGVYEKYEMENRWIYETLPETVFEDYQEYL